MESNQHVKVLKFGREKKATVGSLKNNDDYFCFDIYMCTLYSTHLQVCCVLSFHCLLVDGSYSIQDMFGRCDSRCAVGASDH